MVHVAVLIVFAFMVGWLGTSIATEYSTPIVFLAYPWAHRLAWLGPVLFVAAAAALAIGSFGVHIAQRRGQGVGPSETLRLARRLVVNALAFVFLAMILELLSFMAMNSDLVMARGRIYRIVEGVSAVGPMVFLATAIASAAIDAYRIAAHMDSVAGRPTG